uniref:NADH-ubiquinone oxidoreductase chain 4L n=1 Tax=Habrophlebiodes zijinensis TaxID=289472 RepID=A0A0B4IKF5_9INSE|nr:NADH dehydrogenase subunit 4L [Habrophlebiodes zijinensis]
MLKIMSLMIMSLFIMVGMFVFVNKHKHLLSTLLSLEFMGLMLFLMMSYLLMNLILEMYYLMIFLSMAVCEGALGSGIVVSMIRSHGSDYFLSYSILQC